MIIESSTLSVILIVVCLLQLIALYVQYATDHTRRGLGWWLLGFTALTISFVTFQLPGGSFLSSHSALPFNLFYVIGMTLLYIGVLRFLGKREKISHLVFFGLVFGLLFLYLDLVRRDLEAQRVVFSAAVAGLSAMTALALLRVRSLAIRRYAAFLAAIFIANGIFFLLRASTPYIIPEYLLLDPATQQSIIYIVIMCVTVLWTFGFIFLINQRLQADTREISANLKMIFNSIPDAVIIIRDLDGIVLDVNEGFQIQAGYARDEIIGKNTGEFLFWQDAASREKMLDAIRKDGSIENMEVDLIRKDGSPFIGLLSARMFTMNEAPCILSVTRDITGAKALEKALRESEEKYRFMTENSSDVIWHLDKNFCFDYISPADERLRGYKNEEVIGTPFWRLFRPELAEEIKKLPDKRVSDESRGVRTGPIVHEMEVRRKDGSWIWVDVNINPHHDGDGKLIGLHGITHDINERKHLQEELLWQAKKDELTGLSNRRHFLEIAAVEIQRSIRYGHNLAVVLSDIDQLKHVNDNFGHAAGDHVLRLFASICQEKIRAGDVLARFGGDEFVLLLPETSSGDAFQIVERIRQILAATHIEVAERAFSVTISSGISCLIGEGDNIDSLVGRADQALYHAKKNGRNRETLYSESIPFMVESTRK